jgi:CHAD domain-containing protein
MNDKDKEAFEKWLNTKAWIGDHAKMAWCEEAWQAACEYKQKEYSNIMDAMTQTSQYNYKLQAKNKEWKEAARSEAEEVNRLQSENKKLREALEFYADRNNWKFQSYRSDCKDVIDFNDLGCRSYTDKADFACSSGGRRAREALKEIKEN